MQGGRLRPDEKQAAKPRGGVARWHFGDGRAWLLTEQGTERKAGVWMVADDPLGQTPLDVLGPEADQLPAAELSAILRANPMRLHGFLRDQRLVAGLGDAWPTRSAGRPGSRRSRSTAKLTDDEVGRLVDAIASCVAEGLAYERSRPDMSASADRPGATHGRAGQPCPRCGDTIRAVEYRAYTVAYCPTCQTGGKILADNTTSKFLK